MSRKRIPFRLRASPAEAEARREWMRARYPSPSPGQAEALASESCAQRLPPIAALEVPLHGAAHAGLEGQRGTPTQLRFDLRAIDGVAAIVTRSIRHELNLRALSAPIGRQFIDKTGNRLHHIKVFSLAAPAYIVGLADAALT